MASFSQSQQQRLISIGSINIVDQCARVSDPEHQLAWLVLVSAFSRRAQPPDCDHIFIYRIDFDFPPRCDDDIGRLLIPVYISKPRSRVAIIHILSFHRRNRRSELATAAHERLTNTTERYGLAQNQVHIHRPGASQPVSLLS
jgi:hypothetical protein